MRRADVGGRVDVRAKESHKREGAEGERVPGSGRSPAGPYFTPICEILKMSLRICKTPDAVNNDVQVRAAAGSHHLPTLRPWPTRAAWKGRSCRQRREGYRVVQVLVISRQEKA